MRNKDEIATGYMEQQMYLHGWYKSYPSEKVIITGAAKSGSIGEAITEELQAADIVWHAYNDDVRSSVGQDWSQYDALVMCHGVSHMDWIENMPDDKLHELVDVNLTGTIRLVKTFVRDTIELKRRKRIISIGSMAYKAVLNASAVYCASKAGLAHFMKCAAWELAPKGYDVYCIHPSNTFGTPMTEDTIEGLMRYRGINRREAEAYWNTGNPRVTQLQPKEIAELVAFILSGKAPYLSGAQLELAGGQR